MSIEATIGIQAENFSGGGGGSFCTPVTLTLGSAGNPQTVVINGLDVNCTSLGNSGVQDGMGASETFQSTTKNVHIESSITDITGADAAFGLLFVSDDGLTVYCGVSYVQVIDQFFDIVSGMPFVDAPPVIDSTYVHDLYLDTATSTAVYLNNKGTNIAPAVNVAYSNTDTVRMVLTGNAGSTLGAVLNQTANFGSSEFTNDPQADKWCD